MIIHNQHDVVLVKCIPNMYMFVNKLNKKLLLDVSLCLQSQTLMINGIIISDVAVRYISHIKLRKSLIII